MNTDAHPGIPDFAYSLCDNNSHQLLFEHDFLFRVSSYSLFFLIRRNSKAVKAKHYRSKNKRCIPRSSATSIKHAPGMQAKTLRTDGRALL